MAKLDKYISEWTERGLITADQAAQIIGYEGAKPKASWFLYGTLTLGVSILSLGVVSLIAANWHQISDSAKLATAFIILASIGLFTFNARNSGKAWLYDVLVLAFQLLGLATIGLIAQVYHSSGQLYEALLFWCCITLPIMLTTTFTFVPFLWTGIFLGSFLYALTDIEIDGRRHFFSASFMTAIAPFVAGLPSLVGRLTRTSGGILKAFDIWTLIFMIAGMMGAEFRGYKFVESLLDPSSSMTLQVMTAVTVVLIAINKQFNRIQKGLLVSSIAAYLVSIYLPMFLENLDVVMAAMTIIELCLIGAFFASSKARVQFNFILMLIGGRFFILFVQALRGLAMTGFGLILSGILLIALGSVWHKRRNQIAQWAERLAQ